MFNDKPFLVLGRAGMDIYADPPGTPIEQAIRFTSALGGSSANIAAGLCKLGQQAALVTCVSDDAVGRFVLSQLAAYGVATTHIRTEGGEARNALAVVDTCGDATQAVLYRNGAADLEMTAADVEPIDYTAYGALVATGTLLATEPSRSATQRAFDLARKAALPIVLDLDYRPYSWASAAEATELTATAAAQADIVIGNDVEFGVLAGSFDQGLDAARALRDQGKLVVYKRGPLGAITLTEQGDFETGIYKTQALKPTGAGDSFMAGFLATLAQGNSTQEAVLTGSAAAAITVSRVGCAPAMPTHEDLRDFRASHTIT